MIAFWKSVLKNRCIFFRKLPNFTGCGVEIYKPTKTHVVSLCMSRYYPHSFSTNIFEIVPMLRSQWPLQKVAFNLPALEVFIFALSTKAVLDSCMRNSVKSESHCGQNLKDPESWQDPLFTRLPPCLALSVYRCKNIFWMAFDIHPFSSHKKVISVPKAFFLLLRHSSFSWWPHSSKYTQFKFQQS